MIKIVQSEMLQLMTEIKMVKQN